MLNTMEKMHLDLQFSHRKSTLGNNGRRKGGNLFAGAKPNAGAESAPAQARDIMPNQKISQGTEKIKKEFGGHNQAQSSSNALAQSQQNFENSLGQNNL